MWSKIQLGDVGTWVGGTATFVLLVWTITSLLRQRKIDSRERRVAQARLISAWLEKTSPLTKPYPTLTYAIRNLSDEPAYAVTLKAVCGVRGTFIRYPGVVGPKKLKKVKIYLPGTPRAEYYPELAFVDATGTQWLRGSAGQLKETTPMKVSEQMHPDPGAYSMNNHPTLWLEDKSKH